ncbi:PQQ-binding-like beta-propeller repeat protein [Halosimplex sp. TS25]|uniref:outer membrane protein assembly factor BamB family protein n=1 Tax=Halosimplex rarum TaxID=3396619 RepID=UPI0039E7E036
MNRRTLLRTVGLAGTVGVSGIGGCLGTLAGGPGAFGGDAEWRYGVGGYVDAVAQGRVLGSEDSSAEGARGGVFALDATSGRREWRYGRSNGLTGYTDLVVRDAVYFGVGDDAVGNGSGELYAVEFDGSERWVREFGSVYRAPRIADGVVYVGTDDGVVRAVDATTGTVRWATEFGESSPNVFAVDDAVYAGDESLAAFDREDGSVRWDHAVDDGHVSEVVVDGDVAYVEGYDTVAAFDRGTELWYLDRAGKLKQFAFGHLLVDHGDRLSAFTAADGQRAWSVAADRARVAVGDDRVYVGDEEGSGVVAVDPDDGTKLWDDDLGGEPAETVTVAGIGGESRKGDTQSLLFVEAGDERVLGFDADGERQFDASVEGDIQSLFVDERVFVGTEEAVYALDPAERTPS